MTSSPQDPLYALLHPWATHLGYYDGKIDLGVEDLSGFTTADCTLTAHAPLWGTKPGQEAAVSAAEVRTRLARMLWWSRITRTQMHLAQHPGGEALCLFFVVKARLFFLPFNLMTVPLAFVVKATNAEGDLKISEIHEWPAATPEEAKAMLVAQYDWPADTTFEPHVAFGAVS